MDWYGAIMRQAEEREREIYAQQKEKEVQKIIRMIEKFNLSIEEVLDTFDITKEERKHYKMLIESRMV